MSGSKRSLPFGCVERGEGKVQKEDSLSIYEATLTKLRLGAFTSAGAGTWSGKPHVGKNPSSNGIADSKSQSCHRVACKAASPVAILSCTQESSTRKGGAYCYICTSRFFERNCFHCSRGCCELCFRRCDGCQESFCSICCTSNYKERYDRSFCFDCDREGPSFSEFRTSPPTESGFQQLTSVERMSKKASVRDSAANSCPQCPSITSLSSSGKCCPTNERIADTIPTIRGNERDRTEFARAAPMHEKDKELIDSKLVEWAEQRHGAASGQAGFKGYFSMVDHLFALRALVEKARLKKERLFCCFVDLGDAFITVPPANLWKKLSDQGVPEPWVEYARRVYSNFRPKFTSSAGPTADIMQSLSSAEVPLSRIVCSLYLNDLPAILMADGGRAPDLLSVVIPALLYGADHVVLISRTSVGLKIRMKSFEYYCHNWKLSVSACQARVLVFGADRLWAKTQDFRFLGQKLAVLESLVYLGMPLHESKSWSCAVSWRVASGLRSIHDLLTGTLEKKSQNVRSVFDETILPVVGYGCEIWAVDLSKGDWMKLERVFQEFANRCLQTFVEDANGLKSAKFGDAVVQVDCLARTIEYIRHLHLEQELGNLPGLALRVVQQNNVSGWYLDVVNWLQSWSLSIADMPDEGGSGLRQFLKRLYWEKVKTSPVNYSPRMAPLASLDDYESNDRVRRTYRNTLHLLDIISQDLTR